MFSKAKKFLSQKQYLPVFSFLLVVYFFIGFFLITYTPITTDEVAHLSAGQGITQGLDMNLEHPPLLKFIDGIVLQLVFPNLNSSDSGQWSRSVDFLTNSQYDQSSILLVARLVYLVFNSALIIWLILYTCIFKLIKPQFSLIFAVLYIFSPSFYSHNYLITFDTAGSTTALITILTFALLLFNLEKFNNKQFWTQISVLGLSLFAALNTKFSNFLLLPILILFSLLPLTKSLFQKDYKTFKKVIFSGFSLFFVITTLTWVLYAFCYRNGAVPMITGNDIEIEIDNNWFVDPFIRLFTGLLNSLGRSTFPFQNFVNDRFQVLTFSEFVNRVFWFKENPGLFFIFEVAGFTLILNLLNKLKNYKEIVPLLKKHYTEMILGLLVIVFPVIYMLNAWSTKFTIGYRHFYPVLIFIYFGSSWLLYIFLLKNTTKIKQITAIVLLGFYSIYGLLGIPQTVNYVNFLWSKPKWQLITDSTISWTETGGFGIRYMTQKGLLDVGQTPELGETWNTTFDVAGGPSLPIYLAIATPKDKQVKNTGSVMTDLSRNRIKDIKKKYLVLDLFAIQKLSNEIWNNTDNADISTQNMDYIKNVKPIYSQNDAVFIYKLN